jgi:hypothetical protein
MLNDARCEHAHMMMQAGITGGHQQRWQDVGRTLELVASASRLSSSPTVEPKSRQNSVIMLSTRICIAASCGTSDSDFIAASCSTPTPRPSLKECAHATGFLAWLARACVRSYRLQKWHAVPRAPRAEQRALENEPAVKALPALCLQVTHAPGRHDPPGDQEGSVQDHTHRRVTGEVHRA